MVSSLRAASTASGTPKATSDPRSLCAAARNAAPSPSPTAVRTASIWAGVVSTSSRARSRTSVSSPYSCSSSTASNGGMPSIVRNDLFRVDQRLPALAARLRAARRVTVMTGAGVSAASGVPTFRGPGGLWRTYRPEDLATPDAFAYDPALGWERDAWRREQGAACTPNAAPDVLARWSHRDPRGPGDARGADPSGPRSQTVRVITQNVDDLHIRAGTRDLIRLHGSLWELRCFDGCGQGATPWRDERVPLPDAVPRCPYCGGRARPAVVWFGE